MLITAFASILPDDPISISDCYCNRVLYTVKNNQATAPADIEFILDACSTASYSLPQGVSQTKTDSSTIFSLSTATSFEIYAETGYADGSPCEQITITLEAF